MKEKRIFYLLIFCITFILGNNAYAKEIESYTNKNGVTLTKKEYEFVLEFYGLEHYERMTQDDYEWLEDLNINTNDVEIQTIYDYENGISRTTSHATSNKKISIAKSCSSICTIITNVTWYSNPTVRSYDVLGARLVNTTLANDSITTKLYSSAGTITSSSIKYSGSGFGVSIKLPSGATDISLDQKFYVNTGGYVYASYQHAITTVTLNTSLLYTIGNGGYGGVFNFYGAAVGCYDQMGGVYITT